MSIAPRAWRILRSAATRAAAWPFRVAAARAAMRALGGMDSRELADIGLVRSDLRDVSALALDCDPTVILARRSRERRRVAARAPQPPRGGGRGGGAKAADRAPAGTRETSAAC